VVPGWFHGGSTVVRAVILSERCFAVVDVDNTGLSPRIEHVIELRIEHVDEHVDELARRVEVRSTPSRCQSATSATPPSPVTSTKASAAGGPAQPPWVFAMWFSRPSPAREN
jgi:hypothetical protein